MNVLFACIADNADTPPPGKLNLTGVFDSIGARQFPASHPQMYLVFRLIYEHEDNGRKYSVSVVLRDADHREERLVEMDAQCGTVAPGQFGTNNTLVELKDIVFRAPGRYHFAIRIGSKEAARVPLNVFTAP